MLFQSFSRCASQTARMANLRVRWRGQFETQPADDFPPLVTLIERNCAWSEFVPPWFRQSHQATHQKSQTPLGDSMTGLAAVSFADAPPNSMISATCSVATRNIVYLAKFEKGDVPTPKEVASPIIYAQGRL